MADKKISQLTNAATPLTGAEVLPVVQSGSTVKVSVDNLTAGKAVSAANYTAVRDNVPFRGQLSLQTSTAANFAQITLYDRTTLGAQIYQAYDVVDGVGDFFVQTATASNLFLGTNGTARARIGATSGDVTALSGNFVLGTAGKGIDFSANAHTAGMTSELLNDYEEGVWSPELSFGGGSTGITYSVQAGSHTKIGNRVFVTANLILTSKGSSTGIVRITTPYPVANNNDARGGLALGYVENITFTGQMFVESFQGTSEFRVGYFTEAGGNASITDANFANNSIIMFSGSYYTA